MKYIVISPNNTMMCFDDASQVANFCMEVANNNLDKFVDEQELEYENMTPVEIGFAYNASGTEEIGCVVYETCDIIMAMKEMGADLDSINEVTKLCTTISNKPICYPTYLDDIIDKVTPIPISMLTGNVYSMENL
ncbi:MAG: hypothetical protein BEN19_07535 [Epulopiscium sp. Nuni2H_MBin003]|nr:MAG: hypothetical protein BEN19_07535 [Epulopiscium sp. Nuni2H_MBin003]